MSLNSARQASAFFSRSALRRPRPCIVAKWLSLRGLASESVVSAQTQAIPLRKHLKDETKRKRASERSPNSNASKKTANPLLDKWELTVGIEIHAELNTACKLFSAAPSAAADSAATPNTNVALFDAAMPGAQPHFQRATLLPALRAAIAFGCEIQRKSGWDRKHYFHWDQPNGYQITQYYEPFAKDGTLVLKADDGIPAADLAGAESLNIGIKQIQMEQDTAKTTHVSESTYHIDLNRAGHPLIEIITLPQIHSPQTAAAVVRKVQAVLKSVDACTTGMEIGGLRADVNVSIRQRGTFGTSSYSGVSGLGQRTEIKNLGSLSVIEDAIVAERDRQIAVLEAGGVIQGETRGFALGATETTRLRGKEGEVDYRYMPDPDLPPLIISDELVDFLQATLPEMPNETLIELQHGYGVTGKDARTLIALDDGDRLDFMLETVEILYDRIVYDGTENKVGKLVCNWVLHEIGGLLTTTDTAWQDLAITEEELADILINLLRKQITSRTAKQLLASLHSSGSDDLRLSVEQLIQDGDLRLRALSEEDYMSLAKEIMAENPEIVAAVRDKGQKGKMMWIVGQMVRRREDGTIEPETARAAVERLLSKTP